LQECWRSAQRWLTSISAAMTSAQLGQRVLQEYWDSAQRWCRSISAAMKLEQPGQRVFELRGVAKPLFFFWSGQASGLVLEEEEGEV